ncbi:MAG: hypothetical protein A2Z29_09845 [Chloroflexi bacterium RBG_16_56_11]|nr:MAG: hypothetical protein A2Z29_09845 [Chloroflexi bacterium RBG_16_56_11]
MIDQKPEKTYRQTDVPAGIESLRLDISGHRVHCLRIGKGPPVVFIHGGASDSRDWLPVMAAVSGRYACYAPDLIGYGQSERKKEGYYLSDFSDFLVEFIDSFDIKNPVLVGHSFGARVCLEAALRHPGRFSGIVLVDAAGLGKVTRFGSYLMTFFWLARKLTRRPQPYPRFLTREGENTDWLCSGELPRITAPTLLVWKQCDPYLPVSLARRAAKLIPGAQLIEVPGFGHAPHKQDPDGFNRLLFEFLNSAGFCH